MDKGHARSAKQAVMGHIGAFFLFLLFLHSVCFFFPLHQSRGRG